MKIRSPEDPNQIKLPTLQETLQQQQRLADQNSRFPFNMAASILSDPLYNQFNQSSQVNYSIFEFRRKKIKFTENFHIHKNQENIF